MSTTILITDYAIQLHDFTCSWKVMLLVQQGTKCIRSLLLTMTKKLTFVLS